ncbi:SGNH/GDSL hydrolase family protein [Parabacteroides sp. FAFU027]|uniref:SGNH/GDSL hydrolase family protein n=1 Tax=Parabacteroides sp. FAFU027 TaxID=2922715 RepID=UPI001FB0299A|nr:SGNH/GDSL hydrolase family protein [Parabacteroides sp. FAFU027]
MKKTIVTTCALLLATGFEGSAQQAVQKITPKIEVTAGEKTLQSQWKGKRVAFLGDSMTDKRRVGTTYLYWEYLTELLGIEPSVYGISGNQWDGIYKQTLKLHDEKGAAVDAILIFAGTNDFNHGIPMGEFFSETTKKTNHNGNQVTRKYRIPIMNDSTFCGRINKVMSYLKTTYPQQQIVIMTPIHRGYAKFSEKNVQPDENFANGQGLYIDAYVNALKQAASYWAVPLIDLYSLSGLYPMSDAHAQYFHDKDTDMLHPNAAGDYRLAKTIQYQLLALPASFVQSR